MADVELKTLEFSGHPVFSVSVFLNPHQWILAPECPPPLLDLRWLRQDWIGEFPTLMLWVGGGMAVTAMLAHRDHRLVFIKSSQFVVSNFSCV